MTPERYRQVNHICREALDLAPAERAIYLAEACGGDEALRREVESLLAFDAQSEGMIDQPALEMAALEMAARAMAAEHAEDQAESPAKSGARSLLGQSMGRYRILSLLGKGGMGEVYLGEDTPLGRKAAIKLLPAEFTNDAGRVARFSQEARAASSLNHPNIITVYEIGEAQTESGARRYIVNEYVDGETLRQRMADAPQKRLKPAEAVEIAEQVAAALAAAHEAGIMHRDIKPENVMARRDGIVKVLDFGLAKLSEGSDGVTGRVGDGETKAPGEEANLTPSPRHPVAPSFSLTAPGLLMGTPRYMSPEQARGEKVDARTDIFSLGVMLYEMVGGHAPFTGATPSDVIAAILRDEPSPLANYDSATPPELQRIVSQTLQKDRETRYQTMQELRVDLKRLMRQLERQDELQDERARAGRPTPESEPPAPGAGREMAPTNALESYGSARGGKTKGRNAREWWRAGIALALSLAAVAAVYFSFFGRREIDSLAVLPFVNIGANPNAEYLSDGITDSLINSLSRLPSLKVMSRNSVFRYKGKETDAKQAGEALGVRAVLTGKVTQRGDDLIINVELVNVPDNTHLWGEQYNHKPADLLALQAELARDISQQLRLKLSNETQQRLSKRDTENPEAYELYLKGRYSLNSLEPEEDKKSLEYFQRAIEKDPNYALAYAGLAEYYAETTYIATTSSISPQEAHEKAKAAALRAVKLDDTLAEAHTSLGLIAMLQEWDWKTAEREFKRAIELNPNYVPARHWYSHYFVYQGRFDESLVESRRALALDPIDVGINFHLGFHYFNARQYDQAIAAFQKTLGINKNHSDTHFLLGAVYEQQGRYQEAIAEMQKSNELGSPDMRGWIGHLYASAGQRGEAEKILAQLLEESKRKHVSPVSIAIIYAGLGQPDQTFAWLEKAYTERDSSLTNLKVDPRNDSLRSDSRFADLLRRIGLSQ
jgi:serine/threonine-protein kinase